MLSAQFPFFPISIFQGYAMDTAPRRLILLVSIFVSFSEWILNLCAYFLFPFVSITLVQSLFHSSNFNGTSLNVPPNLGTNLRNRS